MNDTPLDELKSQLNELGLRFQTESWHDENDADVYLGDEKICELKYDEDEEGWYVEEFAPFVCPCPEVPDAIKSRLNEHLAKKKQLTFTVTIEYPADAPKLTAKIEKDLAALVAKSINKLVPGKTKPKAVVVNNRRKSLSRSAKTAR